MDATKRPAVKPPTVLLMGPPGSGKTYSLATLVKAGLSLRVVFTDPGGEESLLDAARDLKLPLDNIHWNYIAPASIDWASFQNIAKRIQTQNYESLSKERHGIEKGKYRQFFDLLALLSDFTCAHCGQSFGPVDSWDASCAFALDSISGLNQMAYDLAVGAKPAPHVGEWGVMMTAEERLLNKLTSDCRCFVICTAHPEPLRDETTGQIAFLPALLGSKLAPRLPRSFSDIVLTVKEGASFTWSTATPRYALKARNLPLREKLQPDFGQIVQSYKRRIDETSSQ